MYVRRKTSPGRKDYYQLVETARVNGKPRQRVVLHLGQHESTKAALKAWPKEIDKLRRRGNNRAADALEIKLGVLENVLPKEAKGPWRVSEGLEGSEGLRWVRSKLGGYDWTQCEQIAVRKARKTQGRIYPPRKKNSNHKSEEEVPLSALYDIVGKKPPRDTGGYRIVVQVQAESSAYPTRMHSLMHSRDSESPILRDQDEVLVYLISRITARYLFDTGQAPKRPAKAGKDVFAERLAERMLEKFRLFRQSPLLGNP